MISLILLSYGDIYITFGCTVIGLIPWAIYFNEQAKFREFMIFCFVAGFAVGTAHFIRSFSGLAVLCFLITLILLNKVLKNRQKLALFLVFLLA